MFATKISDFLHHYVFEVSRISNRSHKRQSISFFKSKTGGDSGGPKIPGNYTHEPGIKSLSHKVVRFDRKRRVRRNDRKNGVKEMLKKKCMCTKSLTRTTE